MLNKLSEVLSTAVWRKEEFHICLFAENKSLPILIDDEHLLILESYCSII